MRLTAAILVAVVCAAGCNGKTDPPSNRDPGHVVNSVVIIHGVGNQLPGYSKPIQDLLTAGNQTLHFREVLWSDLGSVLRQTGAATDKERQAAEQQLLDEINAAELRALAARTTLPPSPAQDETRIREEYAAARGFVSPIVRYEFLSPIERARIQLRLREALDWSAKSADRTFVIAHSLGSVIAFDTLQAWEGGTPPGKVMLLATMGSPLGKGIFASHRGRPARRPANAEAWLNFHSPYDPIASALAGSYSDVEDRGLKTSTLPITAHSAYWTHADVLSELLAKMK